MGKPHTEETKRKISEAKKGKPLSDNHRAKAIEHLRSIPSGMKGKHHSEETKAKLSKANTGRIMPESAIRKSAQMRLVGVKHAESRKLAISKALKGRKLSLETRENISKAIKRVWLTNPSAFKNGANTQGWYNSIKSGRVYCRSSYEKKLCELLDSDNNVEFYELETIDIEYQYKGVKKIYIPDFIIFFTDDDYCVAEVKCEYFLQTDAIVAAKHQAAMAELGNKFIVLTENDLFDSNFSIKSALSQTEIDTLHGGK